MAAVWEARFSYGAALDALDGEDSEWAAARDKAWADFEEARTLWNEAKQAWDGAWGKDIAYWNVRNPDAALAAVKAKFAWDAEEAALEGAIDAAEQALNVDDAVRTGGATAEAEAAARAVWELAARDWRAAWNASAAFIPAGRNAASMMAREWRAALAVSTAAWEKYAAAWETDNPAAAEQAGAAVRRARDARSWDTGWSASLDSIIGAWDAAASNPGPERFVIIGAWDAAAGG